MPDCLGGSSSETKYHCNEGSQQTRTQKNRGGVPDVVNSRRQRRDYCGSRVRTCDVKRPDIDYCDDEFIEAYMVRDGTPPPIPIIMRLGSRERDGSNCGYARVAHPPERGYWSNPSYHFKRTTQRTSDEKFNRQGDGMMDIPFEQGQWRAKHPHRKTTERGYWSNPSYQDQKNIKQGNSAEIFDREGNGMMDTSFEQGQWRAKQPYRERSRIFQTRCRTTEVSGVGLEYVEAGPRHRKAWESYKNVKVGITTRFNNRDGTFKNIRGGEKRQAIRQRRSQKRPVVVA